MIKTLGRNFHFVLYTEAVESIQNNLAVNPLLEVTATNVVPKIIEHISLFHLKILSLTPDHFLYLQSG